MALRLSPLVDTLSLGKTEQFNTIINMISSPGYMQSLYNMIKHTLNKQ